MTAATGSLVGALVSFALTPVLSRIYLPSTLGLASGLIAFASVFVGFSTCRVEVLAHSDSDDRRANAAFYLALKLSLVVSLAIGIVSFFLPLLRGGWEPVWIALLIFAGSIQIIAIAIVTRRRSYGLLSLGQFSQLGGTGIAQLGFGIVSPSKIALLSGFVLARVGWLGAFRSLRTGERRRLNFKDVRGYAVPSGLSALLNGVSNQLPMILMVSVFGASSGGQYAMAFRVLVSPLALLGAGYAAAAVGEVGRCFREGDPGVVRMVRRGMMELALVGLAPALVCLVFGERLITVMLGDQWDVAGRMVSALAVGAFIQFFTVPFAQLLNLSGHSRVLLLWDAGRILILLVVLVSPSALGWSSIAAVWALSIGMVLIYAVLGLLVLKYVGRFVQLEQV